MPRSVYCSSCHQPCDLIRYKSYDYDYSLKWVIRSKCCNDYVEDSKSSILPYESLISTYDYQQSFEVSEDDLL